ncbi:MAG: energy transducer TonB [Thermoanaerobaculia bacterium]|nr:energy transducer TonB [Thermoanaerobaculia bacterium]
MEKEKKAKHFIQQPEYPGGPAALTKFIYANLRYPAAALEAKIEGTVLVEYDIDYKGNVVDTRVLQTLGFGCDEEAVRVVRLLKFAVGRNRGVKVLFHKKAHIRFKLPAPANIPVPAPQPATGMQVNYVYTTAKPEPAEQPKTNTYSYTVTLK